MVNQSLRNRYIQLSRLRDLLKRLFPSDYRIEVSFLSHLI